jgi:hypothetical protein
MTDAKREMIEASEDYKLQYIKLRRWRERCEDDTVWVRFKEVWPDYLHWLKEEVGEESVRIAGAKNRFTAPLILGKWIEKRPSTKPVELRPGKNLLKLWTEEDIREDKLRRKEEEERARKEADDEEATLWEEEK